VAVWSPSWTYRTNVSDTIAFLWLLQLEQCWLLCTWRWRHKFFIVQHCMCICPGSKMLSVKTLYLWGFHRISQKCVLLNLTIWFLSQETSFRHIFSSRTVLTQYKKLFLENLHKISVCVIYSKIWNHQMVSIVASPSKWTENKCTWLLSSVRTGSVLFYEYVPFDWTTVGISWQKPMFQRSVLSPSSGLKISAN
jgi:hypothetical protein